MMYRKVLWVVLGVLLLLALTTTVAWAAPASQEEKNVDPLWAALAPLLAIATAIERFLERFWERYERGRGKKKEEKITWNDLVTAWPHLDGVSEPLRDTPSYKEFKKARGHWLGTLCAFVIIAFTNVRFFYLLKPDFGILFSTNVLFDAGIGGIFDNFTLGTLIDWAATAFIIGWGGTELTHSVIKGLVDGRNVWKEMKEVKKGEKSIMDVQFFRDKIAPELEALGVPVSSLRMALTALDKMDVPVDEVIGELTAGKAEEFLREQGEAGQALLDLLEKNVEQKGYDSAALGQVLDVIDPEIRKRFLGA